MRLTSFALIAVLHASFVLGQTNTSRELAGSLQVLTDPNLCAAATQLLVSEIQTLPSGGIGRMGREPVSSDNCQWEIAGLTPGTYQADLRVPEGSAGSSEPFVVSAGAITRVVIPRANVRVAGQVSIDTMPLAAASVEFMPQDRQHGAISVTTDTNGRYSAILARPGTYDLLLSGKSAPGASKRIDVTAGFNAVDWVLPSGGSLTVRIGGMGGDGPATVHIESRRASHYGDVAPGEAPVVTKYGLAFETYDVSATQGDRLVSAITTVALDASHPAAEVELELVENRSTLILMTPNGSPVGNAEVRAVVPAHSLLRGSRVIRPTEPGVYALDGVRAGMHLRIRADGFVATCRVVPLNSTIYAHLETGRRVEVQLPRDLTPAVIESSLAALSDVPQSDCPVLLRTLDPTVKAPIEPGRPPRFEFAHFPSPWRLGLLRVGLPPRQILVPDYGDVVVERD